MGNMSSSGGGGGSGSGRRRHQHHHSRPPPPPPPPSTPPVNPQPRPQQPEMMPSNRYVFAAATPYPQSSYPTAAPPPSFLNHSPHPQYYQYNGNHHPPLWSPVPSPPPPPHMDLRRQQNYRGQVVQEGAIAGGRYPQQQLHQLPQQQQQQYPVNMMHPPAAPYFVEHQKAVTIHNDVNLKKESLCLEPDEQNPGRFLVSFTFDATVAGRISVFFFAKEGNDCTLASVKGGMFEPVTVTFKKGLAQKFRQPSGTGIDLSLFDEAELTKEGDMEVFPLAVKAEAFSSSDDNEKALKEGPMNNNSQITQSVFEKKEKNEYRVKVVKQILWVNGTRYELQEIYGIGNSVDNDVDGNDQGKECVICLSEPRDTTVLPCRHMCMCSECAKLLRFQTNRCPICRQPVERLLEINVKNNSTENDEEQFL